MKTLKILGPGCSNCQQLLARVEDAIKKLGVECAIEKVEALDEILALGVMRTPALVLDGEVLVMGKVPSAADVEALLARRLGP